MNRPVSLRTAMMDLNDDCLREVFARLNQNQLCDVADTCERFRSLAQETFRTSKFKTLNVKKYIGNDSKYLLRLLRNFGENIESISLYSREWSIAQRNQIFEYVGRHCGRELISMTMTLLLAVITDENVVALRTAIYNLQELKLEYVEDEQALLVNLSSWSPNLRELKISSLNRQANQTGLQQTFPKLKNVYFWNVCVGDIEEFLRLNPQLKELECNNSDDSIFRLVATHVPTIERLEIRARHAIFAENMAYLNQLRSLKVLYLTGDGRGKPPAFETATESLEKLTLYHFDFREISTELTRLRNLKELSLAFVGNVTATHIKIVLIECRQLSHLSLFFCDDFKLSMANIFYILRYGETLKRFVLYCQQDRDDDEEQIIFDADSYLKMVKIVQYRSIERMGTEFAICSSRYVSRIPIELLAEYQHQLKLNIYSSYSCFVSAYSSVLRLVL